MELRAFLLLLMGEPLAGLLAYKIVDAIPALARLAPQAKRWAACAVAGGIAVLAYLVAIAMLYMPAPGDWRAWIAQAFLVATTGFGMSQLIHSRDLPTSR
jgi:hypothetical protein